MGRGQSLCRRCRWDSKLVCVMCWDVFLVLFTPVLVN